MTIESQVFLLEIVEVGITIAKAVVLIATVLLIDSKILNREEKKCS